MDAFKGTHYCDNNGNPTGGSSFGNGFTICWHDHLAEETNLTGAVVSSVLLAVIDRLKYHQTTRLNCKENEEALSHLNLAIKSLEKIKAKKKEG